MPKSKNPKYLQQRYRVWYVALDIPRDVRHLFDGKARFVRSLETESVTEAENRRDPIIAVWQDKISRARQALKDPSMEMELLAEEWREDLNRAGGEELETLKTVLPDHIQRLRFATPEAQDTFERIVRGKTQRLTEHLDHWLATLKQEQKSIDMKASDVRRLAKRHPYTHQISKKGMKLWVHDLQHEDGLAAATVRRILSACRGYWTFLEDRDVVQDTVGPFIGLSPPKNIRTKTGVANERQPFTSTQLVSLLGKTLGDGGKLDADLAALIWFGMWTGCRIEELCQVKVSDVHEDRFLVADSKTRAGRREVPIHPRLKSAVAFWVSSSTDGYLLRASGKNKYSKRSDALGKRFTRLKECQGFGSQHVFHSIRKTVATQLEQSGIPENVSADILGHDKNSMTYGLYSGGTAFSDRIKAVSALSYPLEEVDFAALAREA